MNKMENPDSGDYAEVTPDEEAEALAKLDAMSGPEPMRPASQKQIDYITVLQDERIFPEGFDPKPLSELPRMEASDASALIQLLKGFPIKDNGPEIGEVPAGRYALKSGPDWNFYQVDRPVEGRWGGYVFVKRLIGAPGSWATSNLIKPHAREVSRKIMEVGPERASKDFGIQSGRCGVCGSPLSDAESIKLGIGPVCARRMGW